MSHNAKLLPFYFVVPLFFRQRVSDDCHSKSIFPIDRGTFYAGLHYFVSTVLHLTFFILLTILFLCTMHVIFFFLLSGLKNVSYNLGHSPSYEPFQQILTILTKDISKNAPWSTIFALKGCQKKCTVK